MVKTSRSNRKSCFNTTQGRFRLHKNLHLHTFERSPTFQPPTLSRNESTATPHHTHTNTPSTNITTEHKHHHKTTSPTHTSLHHKTTHTYTRHTRTHTQTPIYTFYTHSASGIKSDFPGALECAILRLKRS